MVGVSKCDERAVCRVPILSDWKYLVGVLEAADAEERLGEAGVSNLVLTLRAAAVHGCGGTLVAAHVDGRYDIPVTASVAVRKHARVAFATFHLRRSLGGAPSTFCEVFDGV
jgi:hypothetical protein